MALKEIKPRSVSDEVFDQLLDEILSERLKPGSSLPAERTLTELFGVNRHAVREAIRRLEQAGLLKVSHGGATKVLDLREHGGLDLIAHLVIGQDGEIDLKITRAAFEMRAAVGADAARLCAERAGQEVRDELVEIAHQLSEHADDLQTLVALDHRFWILLVDGSENIAYRLALNSLIASIARAPEKSHPLLAYELAETEWRLPIANAIAAADPAAAERESRTALDFGLTSAIELLQTLESAEEAA